MVSKPADVLRLRKNPPAQTPPPQGCVDIQYDLSSGVLKAKEFDGTDVPFSIGDSDLSRFYSGVAGQARLEEVAAASPEPHVTLQVARIIRASSTCALDSDIDTGGGTDDTAALQALLDLGGDEASPLEIILDGVALTSSELVVKSYTRIRVLDNCGVFMAASSHRHILTNELSGTTINTHEVEIIGGVWNGNGNNQGKWEDNVSLQGGGGPYDRVVGWNYGFWFSGFQGVSLKDVTVRNSKTFSIVFSNGTDFRVEDVTSVWDDGGVFPATNNNRDGIHMMGDLKRGLIRRYTNNGCDDDVLAFNSDEDANLAEARRGTGGRIEDILVEDTVFIDCVNGIRFYGENGTGYLDNITIRNTTGNLISGTMSCSPPTVNGGSYTGTFASSALLYVGRIEFDGWYVTAENTATNAIIIDNAVSLVLRDIPEGVPQTISQQEAPLSGPNIGTFLQPRGFYPIYNGGGVVTAVSTGSGTPSAAWWRLSTGSTASSSALWRPTSGVFTLWGRGGNNAGVQWEKAVNLCFGGQIDLGVVASGGSMRIQLGRTTSLTTVGILAQKGIGVLLTEGNISLEVHDGTTRLASSTLATYLTGAQYISIRLRAHRGYLQLWVNDVYKGRFAGAPTVGSSNADAGLHVSVANGSSAVSYLADFLPGSLAVFIEP